MPRTPKGGQTAKRTESGSTAGSRGRRVKRRGFLAAAGAAGVAGLAGCSGGGDGGDGGDGGSGDQTTTSGTTTGSQNGSGKQVVNVLSWGGYDAAAKKFEEENPGVTVNVKLLSSDIKGFNLIKGGGWKQFDVLNADNAWCVRHAQADTVLPLKKEDFPSVDKWAGGFDWSYETFRHNDQMWGVPPRWGWVGMGFNDNKADVGDFNNYDFLWTGGPDEKYKGKIVLGSPDWDIPNFALGLGYDPYDMTDKEWEDTKQHIFQAMKNSVATHKATASMRQAMINEDAWIANGQGNFGLSQLRVQGYDNIKGWLPPETANGPGAGTQWTESLSLVKEPNNRDLAIEFINYCLSPEGQYTICYTPPTKGAPVNTEAFDQFKPEEEKTCIMYKDKGFDAIGEIFDKTVTYRIPDNLQDWLDAWEEGKARAGI